jgi:hypothetical protein
MLQHRVIDDVALIGDGGAAKRSPSSSSVMVPSWILAIPSDSRSISSWFIIELASFHRSVAASSDSRPAM